MLWVPTEFEEKKVHELRVLREIQRLKRAIEKDTTQEKAKIE